MGKLSYDLDLSHLRQIKKDIVPSIFTQHQFDLITKRFSNTSLTQSERNEFSRTISRKMRAIYKIMNKDYNDIFIYGEDKIIKSRLNKARSLLKKLSRKFKHKHVIVSGSYLYSEKYQDIDIFVVSKYEKEDYFENYHDEKLHINYLTEDVYNSLFFANLSKLCISNTKITKTKITENVSIDTFVSLYQEIFNDLSRHHKDKFALRQFLTQSAHLADSPVFNSRQLHNLTKSIFSSRKPLEIIKIIFKKTIILGIPTTESVKTMKKMIYIYKSMIKEYNHHKDYYLDLIQPFQDVINIAAK